MRPGADTRSERFLLLLWLGAAFLACDELFSIHENLGSNIAFLEGIPGFERPDDILIAIIALVGMVVLWRFWPLVRTAPAAAWCFAGGVGLFVVAAAFDTVSIGGEEGIELLATAVIATGVAAFVLRKTLDAMRGRRDYAA